MKKDLGKRKDGRRSKVESPFLLLLLFTAATLHAAERFEAAALVDSYDFAAVRGKDGAFLFDTETPEGNLAVLEHVLETGATTILWRNCGGATMRYPSAEERYPLVESPLDKRRLPSDRPVYGWLRYYAAEPDIVRTVLGVCRSRGLGAGIHWPFEETHGAGWTFGAWNFEHPQYWGVTAKGQVWAGRCSLAWPEVVAHKLRLADELLARGTEHLFVDTFRTGGWSPAYEYVRPEVERWRKRHGTEPPENPRDPRWCAQVAETTHAYFDALGKRLKASGRPVCLMLGVSRVKRLSDEPDDMLLTRGIDWKRLVREKIVDAVVLYDVDWDAARAFESTRERVRETVAFCRENGCQVLCPMSMYSFTGKGIPAYQKATGLSAERVVKNLIRIAWEEGADGINMECVDYNNYAPGVREEMRRLLEGECRFKREKP
jgi:hypothetical protein